MSNSLKGKIDNIEKKYYQGKFSEALNEIMNLMKDIDKDDSGFYQVLIWKERLSIKLGDYSEAIERIDNLIENIKKKEFQKLLLDAILLKINILDEIGNYDKTIIEINWGESLLEKLNELDKKKYFSLFYFEKGKYYLTKEEIKTSESLFNESLKICNNMNLCYTKAELLIKLSTIFRKYGDKKKAIELLNDSLQICNKNEYNFLKGKVLQAYGYFYNLEGKLHEALSYTQQSLILFNEIGSIFELGKINVSLGVINHFSGNLNSAINYYQKSLEYFVIIGNKDHIAAAEYNKGLIYNLQGNLKEALECYESSLPIFQEIGKVSLITACFNSIGKLFFDLGLLNKAEDHLRLVYQLKNKITNVSFSKTLFYLIPVLISQNNLEEAKKYVTELELLYEKDKSDVIKHRYLYLKALTESLDDFSNFEEIQKLYLQVINEPITDQEITINSIINYIYLLIERYYQIKEREILKQIIYYNNRLSKLATKQQSKLLFAEFYWIKSILASINGDDTSSKELSTQAKNMAKEMDYLRLVNKMEKATLKS